LYTAALAEFRTKLAEAQALETSARLAENAVLAGRWGEGLELAKTTLNRVECLGGLAVLRALLLRQIGSALMGLNQPDIAQQRLQESLRAARSAGADYEVALTLRADARLAELLGHMWAPDLLAQAGSILTGLGVIEVAEPPVVLTAAPAVPAGPATAPVPAG
ncbi:MAG: hypothetical protein ABR600_09630, partial [Actinomycetota bacterium]